MPRVPARSFTPALRAEFDAFVRRVRPKGFAGVGPRDEREREAGNAIFRYEFLGLPSGLLTGFGTVYIGLRLMDGELSPLGVASLLAGIGLLLLYQRLKPHGRSPTARFLALALPSLNLVPAERLYAEALATGGPPERLELLRRLTDESARLDALAARLGPAPESLARERGAIEADLARATDPSARAALERSLTLAESRLTEAVRADALRQRLDAHRTLLDQSARSVAEGIAFRDPVPETTLAADLGAEVAALEAAVAEMRA